ncbi:DUF4251 domain-containing protein [Nonlabens mediterrranea]|uniref:DUF4251 domain-containing protein n=1 Tax=Nonlabens mediterrranea TaxID=1419947 RepID=A0ABS0A5R5_9FLAO|nr:DUF4251 domain-containing protein [Nonlabens mediterrranea]
MKYIALVVFLIVTLTSCKSRINSADAAQQRKVLDQIAVKVKQDDFQIVMNTAYPLTTNAVNSVLNGILIPNGDSANRIDLSDRDDYIELGMDAVKAELSYYGERRISSGYGNQDNGIEYNGAPVNYRQNIDYEKGKLRIEYQISNQAESFDVTIEIFSNRNANVNISSSHRANIRYTGNMEQIKELAL